MRTLNFFLILLLLAVIPVVSQDISSIPGNIRHLVIQKQGMQTYLVANSSKNKVSYYLVLETDSTENSQALITVDAQGKATLLDRLPLVFPLKRYILDEDVIKDISNQYVKFLINQDLDGKEGIQKCLDHNPLVFCPTAPDLVEAYQKAGLKLPSQNSEKEPSPPAEETPGNPENE